ncbi:hypothetical protein Tco_1014653 [Tanacetum coccineum]
MGDENPIRTLGDYSNPSHEGYRNTIELPIGNNVVPLRSNTIRLVQKDAHSTDFGPRIQTNISKIFKTTSNWLERLLAGSISKWEDLTTRFLAQFFLLGRTANLRRPKPVPRASSTNVPQAYAEATSSYPHELSRQNSFTLCERVHPNPQPEALETNFEARVQDYMAAHTERIERFENAIFKQREEINDRMAEMFKLLMELTASQTPKKLLIREETRHPTTKNVNSITLIRIEEEKSVENNGATDQSMAEPSKSDEQPPKEADKPNEGGRRADDKPAKGASENVTKNEEEEPAGVSSSHAIKRRKLDPREDPNRGVSNFKGRIKGMQIFIGNFTYIIDFMIVEDISSIIDPRLSQVVLGKPFIEISNMTHDLSLGMVKFIDGINEIAYKIPYKIEQYDSLSDLKKEHTSWSTLGTRRTREEEWST